MWNCKHCSKSFEYTSTSEKANHTRWCDQNPARNNTVSLREAQKLSVERKLGKLKLYSVKCERCALPFDVQEREKQHPARERYFCSRACSNHRGAGEEWGEKRNGLKKYTTICFAHHERKCVVCGEDKVVAVHHMDENHHNNDPVNLVPLCPTHHHYWHSQWRDLIKETVVAYIESWKIKKIRNGGPPGNQTPD